MWAALLLAGVITGYDAWHKANPLSPVVMGLCRVLVYVTAALAVAGRVGPAVAGGALALLCYLIGLTYVAKQENLSEVRHLWPLVFLAAPVRLRGAGGRLDRGRRPSCTWASSAGSSTRCPGWSVPAAATSAARS